MTEHTSHTPSPEYLALPPVERQLLHNHFSRMGRKGGKSVARDKRVRAGKIGAAARMKTLAKRMHEEQKSKRILAEIKRDEAKAASNNGTHKPTDIVDNC